LDEGVEVFEFLFLFVEFEAVDEGGYHDGNGDEEGDYELVGHVLTVEMRWNRRMEVVKI
jgi:hypothetical protein